jgi:phosphoglycolate phosphatase-like HAD superfamily hydrolase
MNEPTGNDSFLSSIRILHPEVLNRLGETRQGEVRLSEIRHVLFDFDGTLSVLRQGWEEVMIPLMVECICGLNPALPQIEQEVRDYVDLSTGILTIRQMQWLAETVQRYGLTGEARSASEYKSLYLSRLMFHVRERIARLERGEDAPHQAMVAGAEEFLSGLVQRGARLYLASGTDHADVVREAAALNLLPYFTGGVYGALDHSEDHAKERVIQRILEENNLTGSELLVVGDGPVEIREGALRGALTLGVASDEAARHGWNMHKVERLTAVGADLIVPDFTHFEALIALLFEPDRYAHLIAKNSENNRDIP